MKELDHELYMRRAIELAGNVPEHPFGTVIVDRDTGKIVAEGWNKSRLNPTWHGEIDAINQLILAVPEIDRKNLSFTQTQSPVQCARRRSFGQASKRLSSAPRFGLYNEWDGDRSTFWRKK